MKILALDTAFDGCSVALSAPDQVYQLIESAPRRQAQYLLPMVDELLAQSGLALKDLDGIAWSMGPGSFVGLRIAAGFVQAISFAHQIPVVGVSSLQLYAQSACQLLSESNIFVAMNAYMGELYYAYYQLAADGLVKPVEADTLLKPEDLAAKVFDSGVKVGNGWQAYPDRLGEGMIIQPEAKYLIALAQGRFSTGDVLAADQVVPVYLRTEAAWGG